MVSDEAENIVPATMTVVNTSLINVKDNCLLIIIDDIY